MILMPLADPPSMVLAHHRWIVSNETVIIPDAIPIIKYESIDLEKIIKYEST
jgi:hypothetical protein